MGRHRKPQDSEVELRDEEVMRLHDAFSDIQDQRKEKNPVYTLPVMLTMLVYSTLCGYVGGTGANRYCKSHADYFMNVFHLKGIPAATTFIKVIDSVDHAAVAKAVGAWVETCSLDIIDKYIKLCDNRAFEKAEREEIEKMELELRDKEVNSLAEALSMVPDFRSARGIRYPLIALIVMMIYAALCGYTESEEMETYCEAHKAYFTEMFHLKRTPSHVTFDRVKALLNPKKIAIPVTAWIKTCFKDMRERFHDLLLLHFDGKALRGATEKQNGEPAPYILNAQFEGESIGLIMKKVGKKKNESVEAVEFMDLFNLKGTLVTADAAATTEPMIKKIIDSGGHYILPIKGNQGKIEEAIINKCSTLLSTPAKNPQPGVETMYDECDHIVYRPKKEHGREEVITCTLIKAETVLGELLEEKPFLRSAAHVAVIDKESTRIEKGSEVTTKTRRMFIVSLEDVTPEDVRKIVAAHWHIEMDHWLLDLQLREDRMTSRKGYAMEFGAMLRRLTLVLWKGEQSQNESNGKRGKNTLKTFLINNQASPHRIEQLLQTCAVKSAPTV